MWIWWLVSLLILIACAIFAYRMIMSSYELLPLEKRNFINLFKKPPQEKKSSSPIDALRELTYKLHSVEDSNAYYQAQLSKLQQRLQVLEEVNNSKTNNNNTTVSQNNEIKEDWKELYYEENERKEKLENQLDETMQQLNEMQEQMQVASQKKSELEMIQSGYQSRLLEIDSLKNKIAEMEQQLSSATEREKELEQLLLSEITIREKYIVLQQEYAALQSQSDSLNKTMLDLSKKHLSLETRLQYLSELESKLAACEAEKIRLKKELESQLLR